MAILFGLPGLRAPADCARLARAAAARCGALSRDIVAVHRSGRPGAAREIIHGLDSLSSTVCGVLDPLELARNVHPEREFVAAADAAHTELCGSLHHLNTSGELHAAARLAALSTSGATADDNGGSGDAGVTAALSADESRLARALVAEFEQDGAHLTTSDRSRLEALHAAAAAAAARFVAAARSPPPAGSAPGVWVPASSLSGAPAALLGATRTEAGRVHVRAHHGLLTDTLSHSTDAAARRSLYAAREALGSHALPTLEAMLGARAELARATGHSS